MNHHARIRSSDRIGKDNEMIRKILTCFLCFVLGFATCIGTIVGVGWVAYSMVSIEALEKAGVIDIDEDALRDPDAEVDITKLTVKGLVEEITALSGLSEPISLDLLVERYRLKLPEDTLALIPSEVRALALTDLLSDRGVELILDSTRVEFLYPFLPSDLLSDPAKEALRDKTLSEVVELKLESLLADVKLGYLLGVSYEKNGATGKYEPIYQNPDQPTLPELLSEVNAAELLDILANGGDVTELFGKYMNDALVSHFIGSFVDLSALPLGGVLEGKTFGDILVYDEANDSYSLTLEGLVGGTLADLLGYAPIYLDGTEQIIGWRDADGAAVYGVLRAIAGKSIDELLSSNLDLTVLLSDVYIGDVMSYRPIFDATGNLTAWQDSAGAEPSGVVAPLVDLKLGEIMDGSLDYAEALSGIYVGDLLSYTPVRDDPLDPDRITGWKNGATPLSGIDLAVAYIDLGRLLGDDTYDIGSAFDTLLVGELLGYDKRDGTWYESKTSDARVSDLYASIADLSVGALISGEVDIDETLADLYLGNLLGYEKRGETWYDGKGSSTKLSRLYAEIAALTVGEMTSGDFRFASIFDGLFLGDVLGYTHDGAWYATNPDGTKGAALGKIDAALAGIGLSGLLDGGGFDLASVFASVSIGDALGYYYDGSDWYESSAVGAPKVGGIKARIAGYRLGALIDGSLVIDPAQLISGMTIGEVMGYTPVYKLDTLGEPTDEIDYWCDADKNRVTGFLASIAGEEISSLENGSLMSKLSLGDALGYYYDGSDWYESSNVGAAKVGGIMGVLANQKIDQLGAAIDDVYIGEILGYSKHGEDWYEVYIAQDSPENVKASGIMAAFAGLTVADMSRADAVSTAMNKVTLGDALGYYYNGSDWYESSDAGAEKVGGIMGSLASEKIGGLSSKLESARIGELLGYTNDGGTWYDGINKVTPIINKICNATFDTLNGTLEHLTLGDVFTEEQLSSGFLALLGGDLASRKAIELSTVPAEATSALQNAKIGTLMSCGILNIDPAAQAELDLWSTLAGSDWRLFTIEQFINFVVLLH